MAPGCDTGRITVKIKILLLFAAFAYCGLAAADAETKIGFVNIERILRDAPLAIKAQKKLEKEFEKRDQELQKTAKQLQSMQENLDKNGVTMSEADRRTKEVEFNDLNREFQRRQRQFREELNQRRNEEQAAVLEHADKTIRQIAESEKFDIIFQEAVFASSRVDITDKVIKALGDGSK
jgi:outer membrane protein